MYLLPDFQVPPSCLLSFTAVTPPTPTSHSTPSFPPLEDRLTNVCTSLCLSLTHFFLPKPTILSPSTQFYYHHGLLSYVSSSPWHNLPYAQNAQTQDRHPRRHTRKPHAHRTPIIPQNPSDDRRTAPGPASGNPHRARPMYDEGWVSLLVASVVPWFTSACRSECLLRMLPLSLSLSGRRAPL